MMQVMIEQRTTVEDCGPRRVTWRHLLAHSIQMPVSADLWIADEVEGKEQPQKGTGSLAGNHLTALRGDCAEDEPAFSRSRELGHWPKLSCRVPRFQCSAPVFVGPIGRCSTPT